jgi:hypothetical protein
MCLIPVSQVWWHTAVIPALGRLRQENHKFEASWVTQQVLRSRGCIVSSCLKQNKTKQNKKLKSTLTLKLSLTSLFHSSFKFNMAAKFIGSTFHDTAKV